MNKFALILPLLILAVFLGYFGSRLPKEWVYAIVAVTGVVAAIAGYLLFIEHQKAGDRKRKRTTLATALVTVVLFSVLAGAQLVNLAGANVMFIPAILKIYINSDGSVTPSTVPIQQVGNIYTFTSDLTNSCITVKRDNIVIDGNGFRISSFTFGYHTGITVENQSNVTIKNANIRDFQQGILIQNSSNNTLTGNEIKCGSCILLRQSSSHNQIVGNSMLGYGYGIRGDGLFNNITGNDFAATYGIEMSCNNTIISQNYFENNRSIRLGDKSQHNLITKNTMLGGLYGVILSGSSSNNLVFGNNITRKTECGIKIEGSFSNTVCANNLANNEVGIHIDNPTVPDSGFSYSIDNTFYHNNFVGNTKNVQFTGGSSLNFWDDGKEGNYWSNYNGTDNDGDGIGDTQYIIDENNQDNYPLMNSVEISESEMPNLIPEFPTWTTTLVALGVLTVAVTIYKRRLHRKMRNKKRMSCRYEIERE